MTSLAGRSPLPERADVVIVGAGIVGLAHAAGALAAGASVLVLDRSAEAVGASVRNFGHIGITAQGGVALSYAQAGRADWIRLAHRAGFWLRESGTVVVAHHDDEYAVLADLAEERGDDVVLLDAAAVRDRVPVADTPVGGAWLPQDLRVDPRTAAAALAGWLADQGASFAWSTAVAGIEGTEVRTTRGTVEAGRVVVAVGHDVDQLLPDIAEAAGVQRCRLHMLRITDPTARTYDPAVLTGTSLLRYAGFAASPALPEVRRRVETTDPCAVEAGLNLMFTQHPSGDLIVGDTHAYGPTAPPFQSEADDDLVLTRIRALLGTPSLTVRERWQGVYASAPEPFLIAAPRPEVRVVSVTSGIGMTTAFGLAGAVLGELLT